MTMSIALIGAGRIGRVHAEAIVHNADAGLAAVADAVETAAQSVASAHGAPVATVETIAADPGIDAVVICTPTDTHAGLIETFARAGKAIFCEKPIDLDVGRVRDCLAVVKETGAVLMVGFNRRFDPHFRALKSQIDKGRVGRIEQIVIISRDPAPPPRAYVAASGGLFRDMTIHDFDMARYLIGEPIVRVQATASALVDPTLAELGDYDTATVLMQAQSGAQIVIANSRRASYGYDQRIEVHGSQGMVRADNPRPLDIVTADDTGFSRPPLHDFFMTRYREAYAAEMESFVAAVSGARAVEVGGEDGLEALLLAEAALAAAQSGRAIEL